MRFSWYRYGLVSELIAALIPAQSPPVLIISMPRSGSSWVGSIVGRAENAMYLREPITQSNLAKGEPLSLFEVSSSHPPLGYDIFSKKAFNGLPNFRKNIVCYPGQWGLLKRHKRHLVIKEVNLLALEYFIDAFSPRVIFLVRHPAAVAMSYLNLGWTELHLEERFLGNLTHQGCFSDGQEFWTEHGRLQGLSLTKSLQALKKATDYKIILYEDLCEDPLIKFKEIFNFSELHWNSEIEKLVIAKSDSGEINEQSNAYSTIRNSYKQKHLWKNEINPQALERLRSAFSQYQLPFYDTFEEWNIQ